MSYDAPDQLEVQQELTAAGMRQHYNLGAKLREEYITNLSFLTPLFNHTEIRIRSTDLNRTLMSAQSLFMGFFPGNSLHRSTTPLFYIHLHIRWPHTS